MAVDPRIECLPEHQGPAYRTWQLIMQTTMGKVMQPPSPAFFQFNNNNAKGKPAEEYISLKNTDDEEDGDKENKSEGRTFNHMKRKQEKEIGSDSSEDEDDKTPIAPWKRNAVYPADAYGLHLEIVDFYDYMSPLPEEEFMRKDVFDRLSNVITGIWPSARVEVYGSFRTKSYLPTSDIDVVVFGKWKQLPLFTLERALISKDIADPSTIKVLDKATVPIVKLTDKMSKVRVDINFNTETAVKGAEMIKHYMEEYKIVRYLFCVLKYFLVQRDLNEVFTGGISSYCLMLLVISFLQRHPRTDVKKEKVNLGVLLMEFMELYGRNFNYQKIGIKIVNGGRYISKDEIMQEDKSGKGEYPPLLCIEDPITLGTDIGRSSFGILRVKEAFEYGFNIVDSALRNRTYFKVNPNSTYLSRIIHLPRDVLEYRTWVKEAYGPKLAASQQQQQEDATGVSMPAISAASSDSQVVPTAHIAAQNTSSVVTGQNVATSSAAGNRPPLLPTPPSPYSPRITMVGGPTGSSIMQYPNNANQKSQSSSNNSTSQAPAGSSITPSDVVSSSSAAPAGAIPSPSVQQAGGQPSVQQPFHNQFNFFSALPPTGRASSVSNSAAVSGNMSIMSTASQQQHQNNLPQTTLLLPVTTSGSVLQPVSGSVTPAITTQNSLVFPAGTQQTQYVYAIPPAEHQIGMATMYPVAVSSQQYMGAIHGQESPQRRHSPSNIDQLNSYIVGTVQQQPLTFMGPGTQHHPSARHIYNSHANNAAAAAHRSRSSPNSPRTHRSEFFSRSVSNNGSDNSNNHTGNSKYGSSTNSGHNMASQRYNHQHQDSHHHRNGTSSVGRNSPRNLADASPRNSPRFTRKLLQRSNSTGSTDVPEAAAVAATAQLTDDSVITGRTDVTTVTEKSVDAAVSSVSARATTTSSATVATTSSPSEDLSSTSSQASGSSKMSGAVAAKLPPAMTMSWSNVAAKADMLSKHQHSPNVLPVKHTPGNSDSAPPQTTKVAPPSATTQPGQSRQQQARNSSNPTSNAAPSVKRMPATSSLHDVIQISDSDSDNNNNSDSGEAAPSPRLPSAAAPPAVTHKLPESVYLQSTMPYVQRTNYASVLANSTSKDRSPASTSPVPPSTTAADQKRTQQQQQQQQQRKQYPASSSSSSKQNSSSSSSSAPRTYAKSAASVPGSSSQHRN